MLFRLVFLSAGIFGLAHAQTADLIVRNARIYTVDSRTPTASAIAVRGGKIAAVGDDLNAFEGAATKVIDAKGATIIPGLIDSHGHVTGLGASLEMLDLRGATSEAEIAGKVKAAAAKAAPGEWILGRGWDQNLWTTKQFPTAASITDAAPKNPVALTRIDGHASWVNRAAIDAADVNAGTKDPDGGRVMRDGGGRPAGVFIDTAQELVRRKVPPPSPEQVLRQISRALAECARLGLTSVHDAGVTEAEITAYHALQQQGKMPVKVYAMLSNSPALVDKWLARGPELGEFFTVRSIKVYADGALGSRGAALLAPYADEKGSTGLVITGQAAIQAVAVKAAARGFQVNTHAIGDRGNRETLDAYAAALKGPNDKRFRVEHAQMIAPEDFAKFQKFSIIASMQPTHATSDMGWAADRLGPERVKGAYAWQTLMKLGVHLASGSDFPVELANPIDGFYAAVTRQDKQGKPAGGWYPEQRLSREEALRSWTLEGAYAAFEENSKGSLAPGKAADFVMLSNDIMTVPEAEILRTKVTMTVVDGKIVHQE
ncbi:MAG: Amidohydrolase 3 [Bryobacterales bacterium]|nr:Amidohydrolase 3 [Bryobacterales bacterium]